MTCGGKYQLQEMQRLIDQYRELIKQEPTEENLNRLLEIYEEYAEIASDFAKSEYARALLASCTRDADQRH